MEQTENNNNTVIINNAELGQDAIIEGSKDKLPKFVLPRGERLYISIEQIDKLNNQFFNILTALKEGTAQAPAELRSVMESVISLSYSEEINKLRNASYLESVIEEERQDSLNTILMPRTWRRFFRRRCNESQAMLDELVRRQVKLFLENKAAELPIMEGEEMNQVEQLPFTVIFQKLVEELPRMRRRRYVTVFELLQQLANGYNNKVAECKRLAEELEQAQKRAADAEEKARVAEETLGEFLKDSEPTPEETESTEEKPKEEPKKPEEAEQAESEREAEDGEPPETEEKEEEAEQEPADEGESDGLSYDGLDEEYEQE